ncbi:MAG: energy-coupling factor transporter transmembrane protein EcfT [Lachnospiraceae bacterium]|nr:energy-coupling factor transporter transmembrane protein EcfT [Lachnospiraceae bacterium]
MDFYGSDERGLIKLDPRTKFFIFLASGIMTFRSYSDVGTALYSVLLCIIFALCGKPIQALKASLLLGLVLFFRVVLQNSQGAPEVIVLLITALTTVFMFGFPTVMSLLLIVKTTRISQFLSAFQAMHFPVKVIIPIAVFFRFLPTVTDEWNGVRKAMAFRGISLRPVQIILNPWKTIEYILIPMLFSSMAVMEELASATMARGMDVDIKRTSYEQVKFGITDLVMVILLIGAIIFTTILGNSVKGGTVL